MQLRNKIISYLAQKARMLGFTFREDEDPRVIAMQRTIGQLGKIEFKVEFYPDGSWSAESTNITGILTGSPSHNDIPTLVRDAVFTYFGIPPHLCNDRLLKADNESATNTRRIYV